MRSTRQSYPDVSQKYKIRPRPVQKAKENQKKKKVFVIKHLVVHSSDLKKKKKKALLPLSSGMTPDYTIEV